VSTPAPVCPLSNEAEVGALYLRDAVAAQQPLMVWALPLNDTLGTFGL
jgi:hypothetical protein